MSARFMGRWPLHRCSLALTGDQYELTVSLVDDSKVTVRGEGLLSSPVGFWEGRRPRLRCRGRDPVSQTYRRRTKMSSNLWCVIGSDPAAGGIRRRR